MADDRDDAISNSEDFQNNQQRNEKQFLLLLISLYRDAPELWKVKSQYYYDKNKKALTLSRITNALKVLKPNYTEDDLKKKINILRTNFNRELNKKKLSMRSGAGSDEIYVPKLWYFNEMMFLADSVDIADTENSINSQDVSGSETDSGRHTESSQKKKKAKSRDDIQLELMSVASSYFNKPEDEDEILAKAWAVQLKKLSETQKRFAKKIINDVLFEGEMGSLTRNGVCFLPDSSSMNSSKTPNLIYSSHSEYSESPEPQEFRVPINSPSPSSCSSSSLPTVVESITEKNPKNRKSPSKTFAPRKTTSSHIPSKTATKNKIIVKKETQDLNQHRISQSSSQKPLKTTPMFSSPATNLSSVLVRSVPQSYLLQSTSETEGYVQPSDLGISYTNVYTRQSQSTSERVDDTQRGARVREDVELISVANYVDSEVTINDTQPGLPVSQEEELTSAANYLKNYSCF